MHDNLKLSKILINSNADVNFQKQVLGLPSIMEKLQVLKTNMENMNIPMRRH